MRCAVFGAFLPFYLEERIKKDKRAEEKMEDSCVSSFITIKCQGTMVRRHPWPLLRRCRSGTQLTLKGPLNDTIMKGGGWRRGGERRKRKKSLRPKMQKYSLVNNYINHNDYWQPSFPFLDFIQDERSIIWNWNRRKGKEGEKESGFCSRTEYSSMQCMRGKLVDIYSLHLQWSSSRTISTSKGKLSLTFRAWAFARFDFSYGWKHCPNLFLSGQIVDTLWWWNCWGNSILIVER